MSKHNIVNPDHYKVAGRLAPDDWARERRKQNESLPGRRSRRQRPLPPWMTGNHAQGAPASSEPSKTSATSGEARDEHERETRDHSEPHGERGSRAERPKRETRAGARHGARSSDARPRARPTAAGATRTKAPSAGHKARSKKRA
jgi:23S rRNA pseudouridine2605 synthase